MINIPIWLFVILVTLSSILVIIFVATIISYVAYCSYNNKVIEKQIKEKYGKGE